MSKKLTENDIINLRRQLISESEKASEKLGLNDEQCVALIDCYLNRCSLPEKTFAKLHICVNRPPCNPGEIETTFRGIDGGRKWCKGRSKIGEDKFYQQARKIVEQANQEREKRLQKIQSEEKKEMAESNQTINELQKRLDSLRRYIDLGELQRPPGVDIDVYIQSEEKLEQRIKQLLITSSELQSERKMVQAAEQSVLMIQRTVKNGKKERLASEEKVSRFDRDIDQQTDQVNAEMLKLLKKFNKHMNDIDSRIKRVEKELKQTNTYGRRLVGEERWAEYLARIVKQSPAKILKQVLTMPVFMIKVVVLKPAYYAFWYFFGRWAYLIWGLLMLLLVIMTLMSTYLLMDKHLPGIMNGLWSIAILLWSVCKQSGSLIAQKLEPLFGESLNILWENVTEYATVGKNAILNLFWNLWSGILELIKNIVTDTVKSSVSNIWPF